MKYIKRILLGALAALLSLSLMSCKERPRPKACEPLPVINGYRYPYVPGREYTLRIPEQLWIKLKGDACDEADDVDLPINGTRGDLNGLEKKLLPIPENTHHTHMGLTLKVDRYDKNQKNPFEYSRLLPHSKYPIALLLNAQGNLVTTDRGVPLWLPTKFNQAEGMYFFIIICAFGWGENKTIDYLLDADMGDTGNSECSGRMLIEHNNKRIGVRIDFFKQSAPYVNEMYHNAYQIARDYLN